jgi:DNA-directed RNA polymerase specialized sigma24 family protein
MQDRDEVGRDYYHRIDALRVDEAEDIELAFKLQNYPHRDPELLKLLIDRYASPLYRWIDVLRYYQRKAEPGQAEILAVLQDVFTRAFSHMEQFHGQASVFAWLFGITYQVIKNQALSDRFRRFWKNHRHRARLAGQQGALGWENLAQLPEMQRISLILRYLFNLGLPSIAAILNLQTKDIHLRLVSGLKHLFSKPKLADIDLRIFSYVDGYWDDDQNALNQFIEHLETCELCKASLVAINGLEKTLQKSLGARWEPVELDKELRDSLTRAVLLKLQQIDARWKPKINLGQAAWMVGLSIMFIGMAFVFIRLTPVEREFPQAEVNPTPQLPPVISMPPEQVSSDRVNNLEAAPQYINPAFSSDGKWAAFSYINVEPYTQRLELPAINLYNREQNTFQVISENTATIGTSWSWWGSVWWGLAPSISGNGQRVVYTSSTHDLKIAGSPCETQDRHDCLDIFLYDRETGVTKRITQSLRGGGSNGDSLAPTISEDGKWVAFWSAADNLVEGDKDQCQQASVFNNCLSIYLYRVETGRIDRIPIQNLPNDEVLGIDRISLSADGRYVGFTLSSSSQPGDYTVPSPTPANSAQNLGTAITEYATMPVTGQSGEAVVYDRLTGIVELENQAPDGTEGNGPSSSPVL